MMPRAKPKPAATNKESSENKCTLALRYDALKNKKKVPESTTVVTFKKYADVIHAGPSRPLHLQQYKFEKRPNIKIEYEKDPAEKEEAGLWEPPKWRDFLLNLRKMRANHDAPVDTMGCHMSKDANAPPEVIRYQHLVSLMLSSQTKDQVTFAAMERLIARGLTIDNVLKMSDEELGQLIYPVGFWKTKVKYIKKTTQTLKELYNGDIPDSAEKLCKLTGVGPKMAHICMSVAWNKVTGIGVDTHVHRISNRIGWVKKPTSTPEETRKSLETWLPFDLWSEVNHLMVGFGQTICLPIAPQCHECLNKDICPSSGLGKKSPKKSPMKSKVDDEVDTKLEPEKIVPEKSPRKRKVTPKKSDEEEITQKGSTDTLAIESSIKSPKVRKITPKKNAEGQTLNEQDMDNFENRTDILTIKIETEIKSPRGRKVIKKNVKEENLDGQDMADIEVLANKGQTKNKSPRVRKVPKKNVEGENLDEQDMGDIEVKTETLTNIVEEKKKSPRVKKVSKKNVEEENLDEQDMGDIKVLAKEVEANKKPPRVRKVTPKNNVEDENMDGIEVNKKTLANKVEANKISPRIRRVSPRGNVKQEKVDEQSMGDKITIIVHTAESNKTSPRARNVTVTVNKAQTNYLMPPNAVKSKAPRTKAKSVKKDAV